MNNVSNFFLFSDVRGALPDRPHFGGTFFDTFHRPLVLVIDFFRYYFFGLWGLGYHLTNVFFHALNTSLIFLISTTYVPLVPALLASVFFGFHPQIAYTFGRVDCLQYSLNLTFILLMLVCFKRYLDSKKSRYYFLTCLLFITSLLLRETAIVLPIIVTIGSMLYLGKNFLHALKITRPLWALTFLFLSIRLYLYPITATSSPLPWLTREATLTKKCDFIYTTTCAIISDFFSLSWFSPASNSLKMAVVIVVLSFFMVLFFRNNHKKYCVFFVASTLMMLWPAYLTGGYHPRYLYEAMPFIIAFFMVIFMGYNFGHNNNAYSLINNSNSYACRPSEGWDPGLSSCLYRLFKNKSFFRRPGSQPSDYAKATTDKSLGLPATAHRASAGGQIKSFTPVFIKTALSLLLGFYIFLTIECFTVKRKNLARVRSAFDELVITNNLQQPIVITGTPTKPFGNGLPNLIRIIQQEHQYPLYFMNMLPAPFTPLKKNGWYLSINELRPCHTVKRDNITLSKKILDQHPLVISWDYEKNKFKTWMIERN